MIIAQAEQPHRAAVRLLGPHDLNRVAVASSGFDKG
jgi:hypothetical protein